MATTLYFRNTTAATMLGSVVPTARQSTMTGASTIFYEGDSAGAITCLDMKYEPGSSKTSNGGTNRAETKSTTYAHWHKAWISAPLNGNQNILNTGTFQVLLDMVENAAQHNEYPRVQIWVAKGTDATLRGTLYNETASATECGTGEARTVYFNTNPSATVNALDGDRIVIEVMGWCNQPSTTSNKTSILYWDAAAGGNGDSYLYFSQTLNFKRSIKPGAPSDFAAQGIAVNDKNDTANAYRLKKNLHMRHNASNAGRPGVSLTVSEANSGAVARFKKTLRKRLGASQLYTLWDALIWASDLETARGGKARNCVTDTTTWDGTQTNITLGDTASGKYGSCTSVPDRLAARYITADNTTTTTGTFCPAAMTAVVWVKVTPGTYYDVFATLFCKGAHWTIQLEYASADAKLYGYSSLTGIAGYMPNGVAADNNWHMMCLRCTGNGGTAYLSWDDGVPGLTKAAATLSYAIPGQAIRVCGGGAVASTPDATYCDDALYFNRCLTDNEVIALYKSNRGLNLNALTGDKHFFGAAVTDRVTKKIKHVLNQGITVDEKQVGDAIRRLKKYFVMRFSAQNAGRPQASVTVGDGDAGKGGLLTIIKTSVSIKTITLIENAVSGFRGVTDNLAKQFTMRFTASNAGRPQQGITVSDLNTGTVRRLKKYFKKKLSSGISVLEDYNPRLHANYGKYFPPLALPKNTYYADSANTHGLSPCHDSKIQAVNCTLDGASRKYIAVDYYPTGDSSKGPRLYYTNSLNAPWIPYSGNPLTQDGAAFGSDPRTINIVFDGTDYWLAAALDLVDFIVLYKNVVSGVPTDFSAVDLWEPLVTGSAGNTYLFKDPIGGNWCIYVFTTAGAPTAHNYVTVRSAATLAGLSAATETIVLETFASNTSYPTVAYFDEHYFMLLESSVPGYYVVYAFSCDTYNGTFKQCPVKTVITDNPDWVACPVMMFDDANSTLYLYTSEHLATDGASVWRQDQRTVLTSQAVLGLHCDNGHTNNWTNPDNAHNPVRDLLYATATPAPGTSIVGQWVNYQFDTLIPATATIVSVEVIPDWKISTGTGKSLLRVRVTWDGHDGTGTWSGYYDDYNEPTTQYTHHFDVTGATAWTRTKLLDDNFCVEVTAQNQHTLYSPTFSLDRVTVRVTYTVPTKPLVLFESSAENSNDAPTQIDFGVSATMGARKFWKRITQSARVIDTYARIYDNFIHISQGLRVSASAFKRFTKKISESFKMVDSLLKKVTRRLSQGVAISGNLIKKFKKVLNGGITVTDVFAKRTKQVLFQSIRVTDNLSKRFKRVMTQGLTITDNLIKKFHKVISDAAMVVDKGLTIIKSGGGVVSKTLSQGITIVATWQPVIKVSQALTVAGNTVKTLRRKMTESFLIGGGLRKYFTKSKSTGIRVTDNLTRSSRRVLSQAVAVTANIVKKPIKVLTDSVKVYDWISRRGLGKVVGQAITVVAAVTRRNFWKVINQSITVAHSTANLGKIVQIFVEQAVVFSSNIAKRFKKVISQAVPMLEDYNPRLPTSYGRYFPPLDIPKNTFYADSLYTHGLSPCHDSKIQVCNCVVDGVSRKYLAVDYYPSGANPDLRLYYTDDLNAPWVPYSGNPLQVDLFGIWVDARTPNLVKVGADYYMVVGQIGMGGQMYMFKNFVAGDPTMWWFVEPLANQPFGYDAEVGLANASNVFLWQNPNDNKWYLYYWNKYGLPVTVGKIFVRSANNIEDLITASDTLVMTTPDITTSYPTVAYFDEQYFLLFETSTPGNYELIAYSSDSPTSGFKPCPVVQITAETPDNVACPVMVYDDTNNTLYLYTSEEYSTDVGDIWRQDQRTVLTSQAVTGGASAIGANVWTDPANAYGTTRDLSYATATPPVSASTVGEWTGYGFDLTIPATATIVSVEVIPDWKLSGVGKSLLGVRVSWDGGTTWSTIQYDFNEWTTQYNKAFNVTSATAWTSTKLQDANFIVEVTAVNQHTSYTPTFYLDRVPVRVTFTIPEKAICLFESNPELSDTQPLQYNFGVTDVLVGAGRSLAQYIVQDVFIAIGKFEVLLNPTTITKVFSEALRVAVDNVPPVWRLVKTFFKKIMPISWPAWVWDKTNAIFDGETPDPSDANSWYNWVLPSANYRCALVNATPGDCAGKYGLATTFSAVAPISRGTVSNIQNDNVNIVAALWFYPTSTDTQQVLAGSWNPNAGGYWNWVLAFNGKANPLAGPYAYTRWGLKTAEFAGWLPGPVTLNQWHFVVWTRKLVGGNFENTIYLDGVPGVAATTLISVNSGNWDIYIGGEDPGGLFADVFAGRIEEVFLWSNDGNEDPWTDAEIAELYNFGRKVMIRPTEETGAGMQYKDKLSKTANKKLSTGFAINDINFSEITFTLTEITPLAGTYPRPARLATLSLRVTRLDGSIITGCTVTADVHKPDGTTYKNLTFTESTASPGLYSATFRILGSDPLGAYPFDVVANFKGIISGTYTGFLVVFQGPVSGIRYR